MNVWPVARVRISQYIPKAQSTTLPRLTHRVSQPVSQSVSCQQTVELLCVQWRQPEALKF